MIKLIYCVKRRPDITDEEFHRYWLEEHGPLVRRYADQIGMVRYVQRHTTDLGLLQPGAPGVGEGYDGIAEIWWESREAMQNRPAGPEREQMSKEIFEDEAKFIDHSRSTRFYVEDHVIIDKL